MNMVNPLKTITPSERLWVHSDFKDLIYLGECYDDIRPLTLLHTVPLGGWEDVDVASFFGGGDALFARRTKMGQLVREIKLAFDGEKGLFKKGARNLFYLQAWSGGVCPVQLSCSTSSSVWKLDVFVFGSFHRYPEGTKVYGN